jgi:hypothetical protein
MPAPLWLARFNLRVTNLFSCSGAASGSSSPLRGRESQWVKNVLAQGGCELETERRARRLSNARRIHDERRSAMPPANVAQFCDGREARAACLGRQPR